MLTLNKYWNAKRMQCNLAKYSKSDEQFTNSVRIIRTGIGVSSKCKIALWYNGYRSISGMQTIESANSSNSLMSAIYNWIINLMKNNKTIWKNNTKSNLTWSSADAKLSAESKLGSDIERWRAFSPLRLLFRNKTERWSRNSSSLWSCNCHAKSKRFWISRQNSESSGVVGVWYATSASSQKLITVSKASIPKIDV